ncbi:hypothetical protein [Bacteroides sp.]|uniref:hypothetical protein n=1 Tax=Bacteroides sp. TaxID=29523 RepID=UPI0026172B52|nr:hypothetical protein [Bacteroides sp.]MDD3040962.1 hypothetical protein [Bacteroides sp.]
MKKEIKRVLDKIIAAKGFQLYHRYKWPGGQDSWHSYFEACKQYGQDTQNTMQ